MDAPMPREGIATIREELVREFASEIQPHEVDRVVSEAARELSDARIQSFVPLLVRKESRAALRRLSSAHRYPRARFDDS